MKKGIKKSQIMITALALMIAVAGYLQFSGTKLDEQTILDMEGLNDGESALLEEDTLNSNMEETDVAAMLDISEEDLENAPDTDIPSMDTEVELVDNYSEDEMAAPGESVYTSAQTISLSDAKMQKEQVRAQNKASLLEIVNNAELTESAKQSAVDHLVALTTISEKEIAAEILLEAKGFDNAVVSMNENTVDVVVGLTEISDAQRAQIEDIVSRKTGMNMENIIITPVSSN